SLTNTNSMHRILRELYFAVAGFFSDSSCDKVDDQAGAKLHTRGSTAFVCRPAANNVNMSAWATEVAERIYDASTLQLCRLAELLPHAAIVASKRTKAATGICCAFDKTRSRKPDRGRSATG